MQANGLDGYRLKLQNGRMIGYAEYGDPEGTPVIGLHGTPGSRFMMKAVEKAAIAHRIRVIAPERPGYGLSQPCPKRALLGYTSDVVELADALGLERFAVLGVSGGGPYAVACAYQLPHRLTVAAIVSGIGPLSLPNSTRDMVRANRIVFGLGRLSPALAGFLLPRLINSSLAAMEKHIRNGTSPTSDISPEVFAIIAGDQREAIRTGGGGVAFDMKVLWQPWGFRLEEIRTKVYLWHGEMDNLAPAMLAHYVAKHVPDCQAALWPGEGHTDPLTKHIDEIMAKVVGVSVQRGET